MTIDHFVSVRISSILVWCTKFNAAIEFAICLADERNMFHGQCGIDLLLDYLEAYIYMALVVMAAALAC